MSCPQIFLIVNICQLVQFKRQKCPIKISPQNCKCYVSVLHIAILIIALKLFEKKSLFLCRWDFEEEVDSGLLCVSKLESYLAPYWCLIHTWFQFCSVLLPKLVTSQEGRLGRTLAPQDHPPFGLGLGLGYAIKVDNQLTLPLRSVLNYPGEPNIIMWP